MYTSTFLSLSEALRLIAISAERAAEALRGFHRTWIVIHMPIRGGDWPDKFVLLNRYLRTDREPEYLSDERVEL